MSKIRNKIEEVNSRNEKVLSVFLTAGFPVGFDFVELALRVLDSGADMLEIGIPFSDPLADGAVIQKSSQEVLEKGINLSSVLHFTEEIRKRSDKPIILMGYANPIFHYGVDAFLKDAEIAGVDGVIIPDVPLDEYDDFFGVENDSLDRILLTTPRTSGTRIAEIDCKSSGFVYCVSVSGTTGVRNGFTSEDLISLERTRKMIQRNKMLIGFGISTPGDVKQISPYCDGVIVGSAVIRTLGREGIEGTLQLIRKLKEACRG